MQTPSARTGLLGGMSFDVQIQTAPDIQLESSLTENLQAEANLRLRGTASNPALLGRINITQGKLTFFGTKYTLSQGSISFYNPVKIEPILNIDLETKARGIDITLTVSGPLNKLTPDAAQRPAAAIQRDRGAAGHRADAHFRPVAARRSRVRSRNRGSRWGPRRCSVRRSPVRWRDACSGSSG